VNDKVLVAGIGNIFLGDDGFGVEVVNRLAQQQLPTGVCVADYGIRSYDLAYALMEQWDLVILVDALPRGGKPGTLYVLEPQFPPGAQILPSLDAHTMNPVAVLQLVSALGGEPGRIVVVGCEPSCVDPDGLGNMGLSEGVSAAVDGAVRMIGDLITSARSQTTAA
jgi:hydrogenase maturation protease